jgi:hypothetical protein
MELDNIEKCSKIYALTLQLPLNAQLMDLEMELSDECELISQVKTHTTATDDFNQQASALLTAWDMSNYQLQVSLSPNGTTLVEWSFVIRNFVAKVASNCLSSSSLTRHCCGATLYEYIRRRIEQ